MNELQNSARLRRTGFLVMLGLILSSSAQIGDMVIIPVAESIYGQFADTNIMVLNFILSGPALISVIMAPITGKLLNRVNAKTMMVMGFAFYTVGASCGVLIENASFMAAMRAIAGVGMGVCSVCSVTIIANTFEDENRRGAMLGTWNAGMAVLGAVFSSVSGVVAVSGWENVFKLYLITIPILLYLALAIPKQQMTTDEETKTDVLGDAAVPWGKVLFAYVSYFLVELLFCTMYYQVSMYVAENNIGTVTFSGFAATMITIGTLAGCLLFGPVYARAKRYVSTLFYLLLAIGLLIYLLLPYKTPCIIASFIIGITNGACMSFYQTYFSVIAPPRHAPFVIGIGSGVLGLGMFMSTYFTTFLQFVLGVDTMIGIMVTLLALTVVCTVIQFLRRNAMYPRVRG